MSQGSIPREEQETTISFRRTDKCADVWTNDRTIINKLDKLCEKAPDNYKCVHVSHSLADGEQVMDKTYRIAQKSLISFRSGKKHRELTDEQKRNVAERLRGAKFS